MRSAKEIQEKIRTLEKSINSVKEMVANDTDEEHYYLELHFIISEIETQISMLNWVLNIPDGMLCSEMCCENKATSIDYTGIWYTCDIHREQ